MGRAGWRRGTNRHARCCAACWKGPAEGAETISREGGAARRAAAAKAIEGLGGKLESFYFAFGDVDV
jgi:hypothetical protein